MKNVLQIIFCFFLLFSCNENSNKNNTTKIEKPKPILIKIGYYPAFHLHAETILNLNEKYIIFYSPNSHILKPPPPPTDDSKSKEEHKEYINERPELKPFKCNLSENEIIKIQNILNSFDSKDFSDKNIQPAFDGMSTNTIILFSDGKLIQINPLNDPNPKQRELYGEILNLIIEKNTNKNDSIILKKIKEYR